LSPILYAREKADRAAIIIGYIDKAWRAIFSLLRRRARMTRANARTP
jgi:hypothetical protein